MSKRPLLPVAPDQSDSYESRFNVRTERELRELKTKAKLVYEDRLSGFYSALVAPTGAGTQWVQGDRVRNSAPAELGAPGSKYVIIGWICTVSGTPGTWLEMRTLTGN